ncbi:MAG: TetR/AcrR family transcriptional regulator [Microbacteriaceae bacterium]|nr:TetR/AcrR family transcriptional regulator [Microbacteriaceae bacterium]
MPKLVDHDARRLEIVEATVRVIARAGFEGATMREVAAEGGFANGAIKPYFGSKAALLRATYEHVYDRTNDRVEAAADGAATPREALERFCREVLPLDAARVDEARVAVAFWGASESAPEARELHARFMDGWRERLGALLAALAPERDHRPAVEALLTFLLGAQITAALEPARAGAEQLEAQLRRLLDALLLG